MELRNLGSDLISIMMITVTILVTITTLGSLTRAREQEARPACGSASSACTPVRLLCDLGGGMVNNHLGSGNLGSGHLGSGHLGSGKRS